MRYNAVMGRAPAEQIDLESQLKAAEAQVTIGAMYTHYKSNQKIYKVLGLGFIEADDTLCVIYQAQYGKRLTFVRPVASWLETVHVDGWPVLRFTKQPD